MAYVRISTPRSEGRAEWVVPLEGDELTVGRAPTSSIRLTDLKVSTRHARIARSDEGWVFEDVGSTNGSWRDGKRVARHVLRAGDVVRLGDSSIVFGIGDLPTDVPVVNAAPPATGQPGGQATLLVMAPPEVAARAAGIAAAPALPAPVAAAPPVAPPARAAAPPLSPPPPAAPPSPAATAPSEPLAAPAAAPPFASPAAPAPPPAPASARPAGAPPPPARRPAGVADVSLAIQNDAASRAPRPEPELPGSLSAPAGESRLGPLLLFIGAGLVIIAAVLVFVLR